MDGNEKIERCQITYQYLPLPNDDYIQEDDKTYWINPYTDEIVYYKNDLIK